MSRRRQLMSKYIKRPLDYAFSDSDIAGWKGTTE